MKRTLTAFALALASHEEQVLIATAAKKGVRLRAKTFQGATIRQPPSIPGPIVTVDDADRVEVSRFTIVGSPGCTIGNVQGVRVTGGAQLANIRENLILNISDEGCSTGTATGILVDSASKATLTLNRVDGYLNSGIAVHNTGSSASASTNTLVAGNAVAEDQHGVLATDDAQVQATANTISDNDSAGMEGIGANPPPICTPSGARGTAFAGFSPDCRAEVEPNNSTAAPDPVPVVGDSSITGSISPAGDRDIFQVEVPFGMQIRFETFVPSSPDCTAPLFTGETYLILYDAAGTQIDFDDDSGTPPSCSKLTRFLTAGTYYIAVEEFNLDDPILAYELEIDYAATP